MIRDFTQAEKDQFIAFAVCWEEAVGQARQNVVATEARWLDVPGLLPSSAAFRKRMADMKAGRHERLNFSALLKNHMKACMPNWALVRSDAEEAIWAMPVAPDLWLHIIVNRTARWREGKIFEVELNAVSTSDRVCWFFNRIKLEQLFGYAIGTSAQWVYATKAELQVCLDGMTSALGCVLGFLEEAVRRYLVPIPLAVPAKIERRGPMTAKDGLIEAIALAHKLGNDAQLESVGNTNILFLREVMRVPSLDANGRCTEWGGWGYRFISKQLGSFISIRLKYHGMAHTWILDDPSGPPYDVPLAKQWPDSDEAMRITGLVEADGNTWRLCDGLADVFLTLWAKDSALEPQWKATKVFDGLGDWAWRGRW